MKERDIITDYLEQALNNPELTLDDELDPALEHRLCKIKEYDKRVLRVIINKTVDPVAIVTVYFDRSMKGKL